MRPIIAKSARRGFTLLELMVAVAILLLVIIGLLATFVSCMLLNQANNNLVIATNDAQYVLEQIRGEAYSEIKGYMRDFNPNVIPNSFPPSYGRDIKIVSDPVDIETTKLASITVTITWNERQREKSFSLTTKILKTRQ
jgi:prepilin-type N-terminal cleavage/methylation domain-containing protein